MLLAINPKMMVKILDKDIQKLLEKLNASHEPILLNVESETDSQIMDCLNNVKRKIERDSGKMILGWQIWKTNLLVEAEFHAVWEDKNLNLHDITPKGISIEKILFVEDEKLTYDGTQKDSIRINTTNNELVDDLIKVCEAIYRFDNRGERAFLYDLSSVLNEKQLKHKVNLIELREIVRCILNLNGNQNSICPCQSQKPFIDCHGKNLELIILKDI